MPTHRTAHWALTRTTDQHSGVRGGQGQPILVTTYTKELSCKLEKKLISQNVSLEKMCNKVIVSIK